jgi:CBS-domain-containing membrane protein
MQVTVREIMSSVPCTVPGFTTIIEATTLILDRAVGEIYVCDSDGRLLGAVSDYEILKSRLLQTDTSETVTTIMSRGVQILAPDMLLEEIAGLFRESFHNRVAVVEDGRVIGQVSRRDVLRTLVVLEELQTQPADSANGSADNDLESASVTSTL